MRSRNLRYGSAMSFPPKAGIGWRGGNEDGDEDGDGDGDGADVRWEAIIDMIRAPVSLKC